MVINNNRDRQRTRVVFVPVNTGGGGSQEKIKVGENGIKFGDSTFTKVPNVFDFSDVTDMKYMFTFCQSLTTIPEMDTSKVTTMHSMFNDCQSLTTIPGIDTSRVTTMESMFRGCSSLTNIPEMDTSQVTTMESMFNGCSSLTSVPEMNTSNVTNMWYMFGQCEKITDLGGFIGLKCNLDLSDSSLITHDSLMNIINKVAEVTASSRRLSLGSTNLAKLTDEEKAVATAKGWILS